MRCAEGGVSQATGARPLHGFLTRGITLRTQAWRTRRAGAGGTVRPGPDRLTRFSDSRRYFKLLMEFPQENGRAV